MTDQDDRDVASVVTKDKEKEAKGVDSVTDYVEDREDNVLGSALNSLAQTKDSTSSSDVQISQADLLLVVGELEVTKEKAESMLRRHGGSSATVLRLFISGQI